MSFTAWTASTVYSLNDTVYLTTGDYWLICTTGGTSDSSEPTAPTAIGQTVNDNTAVWNSIGQDIAPRTTQESNIGTALLEWLGGFFKNIVVSGIATLGNGSLMASSAAPTTDAMIANKKYVDDTVSRPNMLINSEMIEGLINQREWVSGATITGPEIYCYDRWRTFAYGNTDATVSKTSTGQRITAPTGGASTSLGLNQLLEAKTVNYLRGKKVVLSIPVTTNNANGVVVQISDGVTTFTSTVHTGGGTEEILTVTATISSAASQMRLFAYGTSITFAAGDYVEISRYAKFEEGEVATPHTIPDPQQELDRCLRYYQRFSSNSGSGYGLLGLGATYSTTAGAALIPLSVPMISAPTMTNSGVTNLRVVTGGASRTISSIGIDANSTVVNGNGEVVLAGFDIQGMSGATANDPMVLRWSASASEYIALDAEI